MRPTVQDISDDPAWRTEEMTLTGARDFRVDVEAPHSESDADLPSLSLQTPHIVQRFHLKFTFSLMT